jgi:CTP:molybdopterin cytidylyltransferase MocA
VRTAGLVLAAGAGRRMGGPKALLRMSADEPTLLESALDRLRAAGCTRLVVVTGAAGGDVGLVAEQAGAEVVHAPDWEEGMGASLRSGLTHLESTSVPGGATVVALVTLVDLPDVTTEVMARLVAAAERDGQQALLRATYHGVPGHPVAIGRAHWKGAAEAATGDRGARDYLRATPHRVVECGDLATGGDVDTVNDLHRP